MKFLHFKTHFNVWYWTVFDWSLCRCYNAHLTVLPCMILYSCYSNYKFIFISYKKQLLFTQAHEIIINMEKFFITFYRVSQKSVLIGIFPYMDWSGHNFGMYHQFWCIRKCFCLSAYTQVLSCSKSMWVIVVTFVSKWIIAYGFRLLGQLV